MSRFKKVSILIPAYNEEGTIAQLITRVKQVSVGGLEKEILVVNDGSKDRTEQILKEIQGIVFYSHARNQGKGAALQTAIAHATGDIMVLQDADLEYNPDDFEVLIRPILAGQSEFVMGSRFRQWGPHFFTKDGDPFFSHYLGNKIIIAMTNFLYGQKYTDYEGCYKAFTRLIAKQIPVHANGFEFDNELMCKSMRRGYKITEVPIQYKPRLYAEGKKITWRHGVIMLWTILKWRFLPF